MPAARPADSLARPLALAYALLVDSNGRLWVADERRLYTLEPGARTLRDSGIAVSWVHGRFDAVCPPDNSLASHRRLTERAGARSRLWLTQAGHLGTEPLNRLALREAISRTSHD